MKFGRSVPDNNLPPGSSRKIRKCRSKNSKRSPVITTLPSPPETTKSWPKTIWTRVVNTVQDAVYRLRAGHRRHYKLIPLKNHRNIVEVMMPPDEGLGVSNIICTNNSNSNIKFNSSNISDKSSNKRSNKSSNNSSNNSRNNSNKTSSSNNNNSSNNISNNNSTKSNNSSDTCSCNKSSNSYNNSSDNYGSENNIISIYGSNNSSHTNRRYPYSNNIRTRNSSTNYRGKNRTRTRSHDDDMCIHNTDNNNSSNNSNYNSNSNQTTKILTSRRYRTRNKALREKTNSISCSSNHVSSSRRKDSNSPCRFERTLTSTSTSNRSRSRSRSISEDLNTNKNTNKSSIKSSISSSFNSRNNMCKTESGIRSSANPRNGMCSSPNSNNMYSSSSSNSCGHSNSSCNIYHNKDRISNNDRVDIVTGSCSSIINNRCFPLQTLTSSNRNNNSNSYTIHTINTKLNTNSNNNSDDINCISTTISTNSNNNSDDINCINTTTITNSNNNSDSINRSSTESSTESNNNSDGINSISTIISTNSNNSSSTLSRSSTIISTNSNNSSSTLSRSSSATATANDTTTNISNNRIHTRHIVRELTPSFRDALYREGLLEFSEPASGRPVLSIAHGFYNSELEAMSCSSTDEQRYKDSLSQMLPAQVIRYQRLFLPQHALEPLVDGLPESVWLTWLEASLPYLATLNAVKHRKSNLSRKKASMSVADCCYASHGDYQHVPFIPLTLGHIRMPFAQHARRRFAGPLLDLPIPGPVRGARRQRLQYQPYPRPEQLRGHA